MAITESTDVRIVRIIPNTGTQKNQQSTKDNKPQVKDTRDDFLIDIADDKRLVI